MGPKVLFLDLDGTLLNDQKEITPGNRQAIEQMLELGHKVVITSGRPLESALLQAERLGLMGQGCYVIAYNGAVVYDCFRKRERFRETLRLEDLYAVFDEANRRGIHIQTYEHGNVLVESRNDTETVRRYCDIIHMNYRVIQDVRGISEPPVKALLIDFQSRTAIEGMLQWINEHMRGKADCFFSSRYYLEVVPAGINKGYSVVNLCQRLGIPIENTIAVGDEANDISMLQAAAIGVAMRNAVPEVKEAANYITQMDNNHDGIAEVIVRFIVSEHGLLCI